MKKKKAPRASPVKKRRKTELASPARAQPASQTKNHQLLKSLILKSLDAFEESFRRKYPDASPEEILNQMTRSLSERTRREHQQPRRSFRFGRHH